MRAQFLEGGRGHAPVEAGRGLGDRCDPVLEHEGQLDAVSPPEPLIVARSFLRKSGSSGCPGDSSQVTLRMLFPR